MMQVLFYSTHEYWVNNQAHLRRVANELKLNMTVHLWPAYFPTRDYSQSLAYQDCAMHKVRQSPVLPSCTCSPLCGVCTPLLPGRAQLRGLL
jgi:hypothetical protein